MRSYKKANLIGQGSYGTVFQGFDEEVGQVIAIKEVDLRILGSNTNSLLAGKIASFEDEMAILSRLNHKNIVQYFGTSRTTDNFHIFLEFCAGGSLAKVIETYQFLPETVIRKYTYQILEGLQYLHAHNVIHRGKCIFNYISIRYQRG